MKTSPRARRTPLVLHFADNQIGAPKKKKASGVSYVHCNRCISAVFSHFFIDKHYEWTCLKRKCRNEPRSLFHTRAVDSGSTWSQASENEPFAKGSYQSPINPANTEAAQTVASAEKLQTRRELPEFRSLRGRLKTRCRQ